MIVAQGSFNSIQHWGQEVGLRAAAGEEGSVASHEVKGDALEQLTDCFMLVRAIVPSKGGPKAFELGHCNLVHTTESFQGDWQENKALLPAGISSLTHFSVISFVQGTAWASCCSPKVRAGQGAGHRHVQGSVLAITPASDQHITRSCCCAREKVSFLL